MTERSRPAALPEPRRPASRDVGSRRDAGFTLLELLVVVTILVAVTAAVGTAALNFLGGARADAARIQLGQIEAGLDLYRLDHGRYPDDAEGLGALVAAPAGADRWRGPYVKGEESLTDPWGRRFLYAAPGGGRPHRVWTLGADAAEGGEGEDADVGL